MPTTAMPEWQHDGLIIEHSEPQALSFLKLSCMIGASTVAIGHVSGCFRIGRGLYGHVSMCCAHERCRRARGVRDIHDVR